MTHAPLPSLRTLALCCGVAAGLLGCSILPVPEEEPALFTLSPKNTFNEDLPTVTKQLVVEVPVAAEGLNSHRIALSRSALSLDYYANARWTERAPLLVQTLLVESFENLGRIVSIAREGTDLRSDFALKTELREFQAQCDDGKAEADGPCPRHRQAGQAAAARDHRGRIVRRRDRLDRHLDQRIVVAFDEALGKVLKRIVHWAMPVIAR
jgi:cholesterol transport system auxiliary component